MVSLKKVSRSSYNLKVLTDNSYLSIDEGRYDVEKDYLVSHEPLSIKRSILRCSHAPIIAELKFSSPREGYLSSSVNEKNIVSIAQEMEHGGAAAISVLTQPRLFSGSIKHLSEVRKNVTLPVLMKDVIVSEVQIDSAKNIGADCILLIKSVFDQDLAEGSIDKFSNLARTKGLSTLVEVHSENEFKDVLEDATNYDLIGINNRNLNTLEVDLDITRKLLQKHNKGKNILVSESGISLQKQVASLKEIGVDAFLIGTSIIKSGNIFSKVRELYLSF